MLSDGRRPVPFPHCSSPENSTVSFKVKTESIRVGSFNVRMRSLFDLNQYPSLYVPEPPGDPSCLPDATAVFPYEICHTTGDDGTSSISSALWPLFGVLWPAGHALATLIDGMDLSGLKVLEVGCGLALAGVVAHRNGADVTVSDYHPLVPGFLLHNLMLNNLPPLPYRHLNWQTDTDPLGRYDLIIGSDILYEPGHSLELSRFLLNHLNDDAMVIIVDPGRRHYKRFSRMMQAADFTLEEVRHTFLEASHAHLSGRILTYRRTARAAPRAVL